MRTIKLTKGYEVIVDDSLFKALSVRSWCAGFSSASQSPYAISSVMERGKQKTLFMHRLIIGATKGDIVDHINHNTLDNRMENLRITDSSGNRMNQNKKFSSLSRFKGVMLVPGKKDRWYSSICRNGHRKHLGQYGSEEEAAIAYNEGAVEIHGEFACLNKI